MSLLPRTTCVLQIYFSIFVLVEEVIMGISAAQRMLGRSSTIISHQITAQLDLELVREAWKDSPLPQSRNLHQSPGLCPLVEGEE
jgi:hypothetical protein